MNLHNIFFTIDLNNLVIYSEPKKQKEKKMIQKKIALLLSIILSGCSTYIPMEEFSFEKFNKQQKGLVFFSVTKSEYNFFHGKHYDVPVSYFRIKNLNDPSKEYIIRTSPAFWGITAPDYTKDYMLFLDPGVYYINHIHVSYPTASYSEYYQEPGIKNGKFVYGAFTVRAGESIDYGQISLPDFNLVKDHRIYEQIQKSPLSSLKIKRNGVYFGPDVSTDLAYSLVKTLIK